MDGAHSRVLAQELADVTATVDDLNEARVHEWLERPSANPRPNMFSCGILIGQTKTAHLLLAKWDKLSAGAALTPVLAGQDGCTREGRRSTWRVTALNSLDDRRFQFFVICQGLPGAKLFQRKSGG